MAECDACMPETALVLGQKADVSRDEHPPLASCVGKLFFIRSAGQISVDRSGDVDAASAQPLGPCSIDVLVKVKPNLHWRRSLGACQATDDRPRP